MKVFAIGKREIGLNKPPYFIAEIGSNHNGDMQLCRKLVDAAKESGADSVKFQSWSETSLVCRAEYERNTSYADKKRHFGSLHAMVKAYQFTPAQHREISAYCHEIGMTFLSSAFSPEEVDLLESLGVPCHKIASMDINNLVLLNHTAATKTPTILSTGMATLGEIERAVEIFDRVSCPLMLLHCVSLYPPDFQTLHLRNIQMLQQVFDRPIGWSDHTEGVTVPIAAIALGAAVIEKHFTVDKNMDGWDHWISADPPEMKRLVEEGCNIFQALGTTVRVVSDAEKAKAKKFRRSIVLRRDMKKGEKLSAELLNYKRAGVGIPPDQTTFVLGRPLAIDKRADEELVWEDIG